MRDEDKSKEQLIAELSELREREEALSVSESEHIADRGGAPRQRREPAAPQQTTSPK